MKGFPGIMRLPVLRELFSSNDTRIEQSDIVMLLTPRIVRTQEITADDLRPINVGTSMNMAIGGQGSVFGTQGPINIGQAPAPSNAVIPGAPAAGVPGPPAAAAPGVPTGVPVPPTNTVSRPVEDLPAAPASPAPPLPANVPAEPIAAATIVVASPGMTVGSTSSVPVSITDASRVTELRLSVTYDPRLLRARAATQGQFMAQGGMELVFAPTIDEAAGRVDLIISRTGDATGASGTGLLASIQFDPIREGSGTIEVSGAATSPEGASVPLQFTATPFTIRK
jgi:general secretion pathway protein D